MQQIENIYPDNKMEMYRLLEQQIAAILDGESDVISNLSNVSAVLNGALREINWVGFYLMKNGSLLLGPFQGNLACVHIQIGRGVCGTAVQQGTTQLVEDVHAFPGHIACDSASNSEIVIPLKKDGKILGVLDIDSPVFSRFDQDDKMHLEKIAELLVMACDWKNCGGYDF